MRYHLNPYETYRSEVQWTAIIGFLEERQYELEKQIQDIQFWRHTNDPDSRDVSLDCLKQEAQVLMGLLIRTTYQRALQESDREIAEAAPKYVGDLDLYVKQETS